MGLRGPKAAPTAVKKAKGETRPSRVNYHEAQVSLLTSLEPPAGLTGPGLKAWKDLALQLTESRVLKSIHRIALENFCRAVTDLRKYEAAAAKAGPELAVAKGYQGMVVKLRAQVSNLGAKLGLDPSSLGGIKVDPEKAKDEDEEFFGGGPRGIISRNRA